MTGIAQIAPAIAMIAALLLLAGSVYLMVKRGDRTKGLLMLVMAVVLIGNVLIWTL